MTRGVFLVCESCGWFGGDANLYEQAVAECDKCGAQRLAAFPGLATALHAANQFSPPLSGEVPAPSGYSPDERLGLWESMRDDPLPDDLSDAALDEMVARFTSNA